MDTWERAQAGLFLALQYPTEVPGVSVESVMTAAFAAGGRSTEGLHATMAAEAERIGFAERFLGRDLNVDLSGGEKKRNETLQLGVLEPKIAILDELDSGLDVDALRACSRRVEQATTETGLGVLAITHYTRLLDELKPDVVHILAKGRIVKTGGPELADELEADGYAAYLPAGEDEAATPAADPSADPFADPFA
jgi:Fe-S cluster assembly ATP-binding protein